MRLAPILVIDNNDAERHLLVQALEKSGFDVRGLQAGPQVMARIKNETFSLVITENRTEDMSALDVVRAVKQKSPSTEVVVLTSNGSVNGAVEAMQAGAADYLTKPLPPDLIENTVKSILAKSAAPEVAARQTPASRRTSLPKRIVTRDTGFLRTLELAKTIAPSKATVLIQGESGTGKELLAQYIHQHSNCSDEPYVAVNCAALPETLAESELFGHEKGAFTGAVSRKIGKFELARKGTVVLDEIGEMPLPLQAKLLRVLQEREIDRVGGTDTVALEARVITISNVDLTAAVAAARFREDLFYRINVVPLKVPPLRERRGDIPILAQYFLEKFSRANQRSMARISDGALEVLMNHSWKGNVRELENTIERAVLIGEGAELEAAHLMLDDIEGVQADMPPGAVSVGTTVRQMEKKLIVTTLAEVDQNRTRAAELLGISIRTLRNKLREYKRESEQMAGPVGR